MKHIRFLFYFIIIWSPTIQISARQTKKGKKIQKQSQDTSVTEITIVLRNIWIFSKYFWEHQSESLSIAPTQHHWKSSFQPLCFAPRLWSSFLSNIRFMDSLCLDWVPNSYLPNTHLCQTVLLYFILLKKWLFYCVYLLCVVLWHLFYFYKMSLSIETAICRFNCLQSLPGWTCWLEHVNLLLQPLEQLPYYGYK